MSGHGQGGLGGRLSLPSRDRLARTPSHIYARRSAFAFARRRTAVLAGWIYRAARRWRATMRKLFPGQVERHLADSADRTHLPSSHQHWDRRVGEEAAAIVQLVVGDPQSAAITMGPIANAYQFLRA